jgi:hypothetical protein
MLLGGGALLIVALAGAAVFALLNQPETEPGGEGNGVSWKTEVVDLRATDFWIDAAGERFHGTRQMQVNSDPGSATYRTLELTWREHGTEMRVNIYFGGDATSWWIDEIRTYDGTAQPDWLYYRAPDIRAPLGQAWEGDVELLSTRSDRPGRGPGTLHFGTLQVATVAARLINVPPGGGIVLKENDDPFAPGGVLHCTDILQLPPKDAEAVLLRLGYRLSWRLTWSTGGNTGYSQPFERAPDGYISMTAVGTSGELIVFVQDPTRPMGGPATFPADCPQSAGTTAPAP